MTNTRREPITKAVTTRGTTAEVEAFLKGMAERPTRDLGTVLNLDQVATKLWDGLPPVSQ